LEDLGVVGRITLEMKLKLREWKGVYWIDLFQFEGKWRAVVKMVMNFWVPYNVGNSLTS